MEEIKKYFRKTPIIEGFLKVNHQLGIKKHTNIYISKNDIKGFRVSELCGEVYHDAYSVEAIFDYKLFGYDVEYSVPVVSDILEFKTSEEAEKAIEFLLKELKK